MYLTQCRVAIGALNNCLYYKRIKLITRILQTIYTIYDYHEVTSSSLGLVILGFLSVLSDQAYLYLVIQTLLARSGDIHVNPPPEKNNELKICHLNARSIASRDTEFRCLQGKLEEIEPTLCNDNNYNAICMTETWIDDTILDADIGVPDFQIDRRDRNRHGGCVAVYTHNNIHAIRRADLEVACELLWVEIFENHKRILLGTCYRPPNQNANERQEFLELFEISLFRVFRSNPDLIIILGDFNDRCTEWHTDHLNSELRNDLRLLLNGKNLFQLFNEPTRITKDSAYILDLLITDNVSFINDFGVAPPIENLGHILCFRYTHSI